SKSSSSELERDIKIRASKLKPKFEKGLYRYSLCFLYLNRLLIHTKKDISSTLKLLPETQKDMPNANQNIGFLLKRAYTEKKKLQEDHEKLKRMRSCLYDLEIYFSELNSVLLNYLKQEEADRVYTAFRARLRYMEFERASQKLHDILKQEDLKKSHLFSNEKEQKIIHLGEKIISILKTNLDDLKRENDMVLDLSELRLLFSFLHTSETRVHKFIDKYTAPFLAFQYQLLLKQAFRLGQIGSFEKLFVLHKDFIQGMTESYDQKESVQFYDNDTLKRAEHTLTSGMSAIPDIFDQMEDAKNDLYQVLSLIRECHTNAE
ncbi:MAG: hypothetical protein AAF569_07085, partial [Pseudomonadota bacterium]